MAQMKLGDLYQFCTSSVEKAKVACRFYIFGVFEVPDDLSSSAVELIVRMKMGEDLAVFPADRDIPAVSLVMAVISKQFPCKRP